MLSLASLSPNIELSKKGLRVRELRGISQVISTIIAMAMLVSMMVAIGIQFTREMRAINAEITLVSKMVEPPVMHLDLISKECSNKGDYVVARLSVEGYPLNGAKAIVYTSDGSIYFSNTFSSNAVQLRLPCNKESAIAITKKGLLLWFYNYRFDPDRNCISGRIINASVLAANPCKPNYKSYNSLLSSEYNSTAVPVYAYWIRARMVNSVLKGEVKADNLVRKYGIAPGLVINVSTLSYDLLSQSKSIQIRYAPSVSASYYSVWGPAPIGESFPVTIEGSTPVCIAPYSCRYEKYYSETHTRDNYIELNTTMTIEYQDANLKQVSNGWLYIKDYRYTWLLKPVIDSEPGETDTIKPDIVYAEPLVRTSVISSMDGCNEELNYNYAHMLYSAPIDIVLFPIIVSRNQSEIDASITIIPINRLATYNVVEKWYDEMLGNGSLLTSQHVFAEAYLLPYMDYDRPLLPVRENVYIQPRYWPFMIRALAHQTLIPPTHIAPTVGNNTYSRIIGGVYRIDLDEMFKETNYNANRALLVIAVVFYTNGTKVLWPSENQVGALPNDREYLGCHPIVATNGIEALLHVSLLPIKLTTNKKCRLLLGIGEKVEKMATMIRYIYFNESYTSHYSENWWSELHDLHFYLEMGSKGYRAGRDEIAIVENFIGSALITRGNPSATGTEDLLWSEQYSFCSAPLVNR